MLSILGISLRHGAAGYSITSSSLAMASRFIPVLSQGFHTSSSNKRWKQDIEDDFKPNLYPKLGEEACRIFRAAVNSVLPTDLVRKTLKIDGGLLYVGKKAYQLNKNVHIVAFGKGVIGMVRAAEDVLGDHVVRGIASVPDGIQDAMKKEGKHDSLPLPSSKVEIYEGAKNNMPDAAAHAAAMRIHDLVKSLKSDDICLVLITGGGSSLLPSPIPPITMEDMFVVTRVLSRAGANISELNTVRSNIELLKGGGLARLAHPANVISLILSDVIGNPLDLIASGPTSLSVPVPHQCLHHFESKGIQSEIPKSVIHVLEDAFKNLKQPPPLLPQTNFDDEKDDTIDLQNLIVGSNQIAVDGACAVAEELGYMPYVLTSTLAGEARDAGVMLSRLAKFASTSMCQTVSHEHSVQELDLVSRGVSKAQLNDVVQIAKESWIQSKPLCIISAGETVVNVKGDGKGGRNQEMALAAAVELDKISQEKKSAVAACHVKFLSAGTDGLDGPCMEAGAMADPLIVNKAKTLGLDAAQYLNNNDSNTFYRKLNDGEDFVVTGPTGTNVMDIQVVLIKPNSN